MNIHTCFFSNTFKLIANNIGNKINMTFTLVLGSQLARTLLKAFLMTNISGGRLFRPKTA